jgi:hypothetical protein
VSLYFSRLFSIFTDRIQTGWELAVAFIYGVAHEFAVYMGHRGVLVVEEWVERTFLVKMAEN